MSAQVLREAAKQARAETEEAVSIGWPRAAQRHGAVADWLDSEAEAFERYLNGQTDPERRFNGLWLDRARVRHEHALAVARAYLGTP